MIFNCLNVRLVDIKKTLSAVAGELSISEVREFGPQWVPVNCDILLDYNLVKQFVKQFVCGQVTLNASDQLSNNILCNTLDG